jgi:hypothetical protein
MQLSKMYYSEDKICRHTGRDDMSAYLNKECTSSQLKKKTLRTSPICMLSEEMLCLLSFQSLNHAFLDLYHMKSSSLTLKMLYI